MTAKKRFLIPAMILVSNAVGFVVVKSLIQPMSLPEPFDQLQSVYNVYSLLGSPILIYLIYRLSCSRLYLSTGWSLVLGMALESFLSVTIFNLFRFGLLAQFCSSGVYQFDAFIKLISVPGALLMGFILYRVYFTEHRSPQRISLEGSARSVAPVRQVSAFPFQIMAQVINFQNIEVLNFLLETDTSPELSSFLPTGFKQSSELQNKILVAVEVRGHIEGMIKDGDHLQLEAWNDGYTLFSDKVRNFSTFSTVKARSPIGLLMYFLTTGGSLIGLLFIAQILSDVVLNMAFYERSPLC